VRIVDDKINVLYVETEPTWDFRYIVDTLQRDRRIKLKVVLIKGDSDLSEDPDSIYLARIPDDRQTLFGNDLVIIGDVDPNQLGADRMNLLNEWVSKMGGGLLFKAGPKFNPNAYHDTPLEPMLPVESEGKTAEEYSDPVQLKLTPAGETSPLLTVSDDPQENIAIWNGFPGVRWTAWADQARPGAQVLLVDPTSSRANSEGPEPVMAVENYGLGQTFYIGTDETYRWRSKIGEKYFTRIYGQIIQALTAQHMEGASQLVQLKTDRASYLTGDKVKISGRIFQTGFTPVTDAEVPGTLTITPTPKPGQPPPPAQTQDVRLEAIPDQPGQYKAEITAQVAGSYSYSVTRAPTVAAKFDVAEPRIEMADIAMNERLLKSMASTSGGTFLREEDLDKLPQMVVDKSAKNVSFKKIPLAFAPALLGLIILIACIEWLWRRKLELK